MKKTIILGLSVVLTLAASVTAFANGSTTETKHNHSETIQVEATSQGKGACRHAGCQCSSYTRRVGGAGKCTCGHWDYVHN